MRGPAQAAAGLLFAVALVSLFCAIWLEDHWQWAATALLLFMVGGALMSSQERD